MLNQDLAATLWTCLFSHKHTWNFAYFNSARVIDGVRRFIRTTIYRTPPPYRHPLPDPREPPHIYVMKNWLLYLSIWTTVQVFSLAAFSARVNKHSTSMLFPIQTCIVPNMFLWNGTESGCHPVKTKGTWLSTTRGNACFIVFTIVCKQ